METLQIKIRPLTAFGGAIKGDTLFGQFCWALVHRYGEAKLTQLLQGYTDGKPFLVCSDAFPQGHIPRPALPLESFVRLPDEDRKRVKKRRWLPLEAVSLPLESWLVHCRTEKEVVRDFNTELDLICQSHPQPHNSIHRNLNTTHGGEFAPYSMEQVWFAPGLSLDIWLLFDAQCLDANQLAEMAVDIGNTGFGRDASVGLGKFKLESAEVTTLPRQQACNAGVTLAPCAPQGIGLRSAHCYYEPFTRFGRHGDRAVLMGKPFKNPLLLANTGAVMSGAASLSSGYVGQGLGGEGKLSNAIPETVHQGYAPCIGIHLKEADE